MRWTLRFLGFATLFAIPCYLVSGPWQRALGAIAASIVSRFGIQIEMQDLEIMAPFDLGIYLAMCLAGRRAPPLARRRALEWGAILMVLLEIVTVTGAVLLFFALQNRAHAPGAGVRLMQTVIEFVPWASATTVWLVMLGAWELPLGAAAAPPSGGRRSASPAAPPPERDPRA